MAVQSLYQIKNTSREVERKRPGLLGAPVNKGSAHLITVSRSNENFADVQRFEVEVNLGSHPFSSDPEGQADLSACKSNSVLPRRYFISPNHPQLITNAKRELLKYSPGLPCIKGTAV